MNKGFFLILILALTLGLYLFWTLNPKSANEPQEPAGALVSEAPFRDKLAEYRMERDKLERHIAQLEAGKEKALEVLKRNNIQKVADAKGNSDAEVAIQNFKSSTEKINDLKTQFAYYDNAISRLSGMLDKLERNRIHSEVKLSEDQEIELRAIVKRLNEELEIGQNDPLLDAEVDQFLKDNLGEEE
jgi:hypothetical protein